MRSSAVVAAAAVACAALPFGLGCGSTTKSVLAPGQSSSCSVTLSGAVSGTYDCKPANTAWSSSNNKGGFAFSVGTSGSNPAITLAIGWPGEPMTTTYPSSDSLVSGGVSVTTGSGAGTQAWAATTGASPHGSFSLSFTEVSNIVTVSGGKAYSTNGTVDATLVPLTGQSGTITLHATF